MDRRQQHRIELLGQAPGDLEGGGGVGAERQVRAVHLERAERQQREAVSGAQVGGDVRPGGAVGVDHQGSSSPAVGVFAPAVRRASRVPSTIGAGRPGADHETAAGRPLAATRG